MSVASHEPVLGSVDREHRLASGKAIRERVRRSEHAHLPERASSFDIVSLLETANADREPALVPIRYFRMASSAFGFFRGSANVMAIDLALTPRTGIDVQLSGDAHCANFGAFATPERNLIFDVRDFDETIRGPWEWDLKRLAASLILASREVGGKDAAQNDAVCAAVCAYREAMHDLADLSTLDVWYARVNVEEIMAEAGSNAFRKKRRTYVDGIGRRTIQKAYDDMTVLDDRGKRVFLDEKPLVYHPAADDVFFNIDQIVASYRRSLSADVLQLFDRYALSDWVVKVVGVGSVGTRCAAALFLAGPDDPLLLQIKEANQSVLEPFVRANGANNHGERVVAGQRTMQAASDIFLGWARSDGRDYYVRQLRDMKGVPDLEDMGDGQLSGFAHYCGRTLAGAHARSGHAAEIAGYLGRGASFDEAIVAFARAYAARVETDHAALVRAIDTGRLESSSIE